MKKILYTRESPCLEPLRSLIEEQDHKTLCLWALDAGAYFLPLFTDRYPEDSRPADALSAARAWMHGEVKMPVAKRAAHATHRAATDVEDDPVACAAARAMGHVIGTVHTDAHAIGVAMYGLTALYRSEGDEEAAAQAAVENCCQWMVERLLYWQDGAKEHPGPFAPFLLREGVPNKEKQRRLKMGNKAKNKRYEPK
ncbi:hypothetical protein LJC20_05835 [Eubacteriales bacterium OttesenSCG-928-M02]|nr:hypothetical protein [Eubacteriales bacterium OttesenSCG-928-M02]